MVSDTVASLHAWLGLDQLVWVLVLLEEGRLFKDPLKS